MSLLLEKQVKYWKGIFEEVGLKYNKLQKEIEPLKEQNKIMREAFDKISFLCEEFFDDDHGDGYEFRDKIELELAKCDKITR